jgi:hypothetical protein
VGDIKMKNFKLNKKNIVYFIIIMLLISLLLNIYTTVMNSRYKILLGKETYSSLVELRNRNESALSILTPCIEANSISNQELFTLYKNYYSIAKEYNELWLRYIDFGKEEIVSINNGDNSSSQLPSNVYSRIETLIFEYMNYQMTNNDENLLLDGNTLKNFAAMENMANQLNNYFVEFDDKYFEDLTEEEKELSSIKNCYWIDSLKGMNSIMEPYFNYEFTIKEAD